MCFRSHKSCICSGQKEIPGCLSIATTKGQVHVTLFFQTKTPLEHNRKLGEGVVVTTASPSPTSFPWSQSMSPLLAL